jgi:hypothetical protein
LTPVIVLPGSENGWSRCQSPPRGRPRRGLPGTSSALAPSHAAWSRSPPRTGHPAQGGRRGSPPGAGPAFRTACRREAESGDQVSRLSRCTPRRESTDQMAFSISCAALPSSAPRR